MLVKKKLLQLPQHPFTPEPAETGFRPDYYYAASVEEGILHLTLFEPDGKPCWRVFCDGENWINYDLAHKSWGKALLYNLGCTRWEIGWRCSTYQSLDKRSSTVGLDFLRGVKGYKDDDTAKRLLRLQDQRRETAVKRERTRREELTKELMADWPQLPPGWQQRMEQGPWRGRHYCFFRKAGKDPLEKGLSKQFGDGVPRYVGECSACGKRFGLDCRTKHDATTMPGKNGCSGSIRCPNCGTLLHPKKAGLGRKNLYEGEYRAFATRRGGQIYIDVAWVTRDYCKEPHVTKATLGYRYWLDTKGNRALRWRNGGLGWELIKESVGEPGLVYTLDQTVEDCAVQTRLGYDKRRWDCGAPLLQLSFLCSYPAVEILDKLGLGALADSFKNHRPLAREALHPERDSLKSVLGVNSREQVAYIRKNKLSAFQLRLYQELIREKKRPDKDFLPLTKGLDMELQPILWKLCKSSGSTKKTLAYLQKQKARAPQYDLGDLVTFCRDYWEECCLLDYDLADSYNRYPPDLVRAHNRTMQLVSQQQNTQKDQQIAKRLEKLRKKYGWEADGFSIRPAESAGELIQEGAMLHHCVATYIDRYAKGETDILLLRKTAAPEVPYVTTEYKNGKRQQAYGDHDSRPEPACLAFLKKYEQWLSSKGKEKKHAVQPSAEG